MSGVIVVGSVNVDLVVRSSTLPSPGETVVGGVFYQAAGGKGANQAAAAARASTLPVHLIAAVGNDAFGEYSRSHLQQAGVQLQAVRNIPALPTGIAVILVDEHGENLISVASGANAHLQSEDLTQLPAVLWQSARTLVTNLESPLPTVLAALRQARHYGLTTILNPAPAQAVVRHREWAELTDVLTPNQSEAELLTGHTVHSPADAEQAGRVLQALGFARVCLTLGEQGVCVIEQTCTWIPALRVTAVDATGAGDCFTGVLGAALAQGLDLVSAARRAVAAAGICVTRAGAQPSLPSAEEIALAEQQGCWPIPVEIQV